PGSPALRATLRYSTCRAAAELALANSTRGLKQSSPTSPGTSALLGGSQGDCSPPSVVDVSTTVRQATF
ncbi:MAG: hypothetical protein ABL891_10820, partial [Burkholderiales bacterium]